MNVLPPFDRLVTTHGARVLRVCRSVAGPDEADDAWSETFLAALRAYPRLDPAADTEAWLVTIAYRKSIDVHRRAAVRAIPVEELPEIGDASLDPAAIVAAPGGGIWAAVAALPPRQRQAVAYHYLGGLTHVAIADLVDGTAASVRRACADGIANLRRQGVALADPSSSTPMGDSSPMGGSSLMTSEGEPR